MAMNLTEGAISMLSTGKWNSTDVKPVLQVLDVRPIPQTLPAGGGGANNERYRMLLSDGLFHQQAMLATQRNDLIRSQQLHKGSIVQLKEFLCNKICDRIVLIIIDLDVILKNCDSIGDAKPWPPMLPTCNGPMHTKPDPVADVSRTTPAISMKLTEGAISMLLSGKWKPTDVKPVLQVLDVRTLPQTLPAGSRGANNERYRLLLSDGSFYQQGMIGTQWNELIRSQQLHKGSIVQLKQFVFNKIRDRIILIIINLDVILENCDFIGDAKPWPHTPQTCNVSMHSRPDPVADVSRNTPAISMKLTEGAISMLSSGKLQLEITDVKPVLQVLDVRIVQAQGGVAENKERYRLLLSDGLFHQQGMLATQRNDLVRSQQLQKGSIVKLKDFACTKIRDARVCIVVIDLDVILQKCDVIGDANPWAFASTTMGSPQSSMGSSSSPIYPQQDHAADSAHLQQELQKLREQVSSIERTFQQTQLDRLSEIERRQAQLEMRQAQIEQQMVAFMRQSGQSGNPTNKY